MSTLHKVKAYFGMAPMEDYEDEYYDDRTPSRGYSRPRFEDDYGRYDGRDREYDEPRRDPRGDLRGELRGEPADYPPPSSYRGGYPEEPRFQPREFDRPDMARPRLGSWLRGSTRGALAMDPRRMAMMFEDGHPLSKITTLRPKDYSEARTIGERFRDGTPVIMDLVSMDNADAKRLVDFAAGLAFALRGSFDKVATKVFLLSPADVDVSPEERRRIAETGFYAYQ
ncbi:MULTISPECIES: cell division protein SepF [Mycobacterium]|jgi:cell division inhibitor SepF|uniref:Cell division protein SepF n=1 Tax=Mycobacterium gordonae TaxID=1778 RepID=A0A1A6BBY7_MYCGO|nr:MULTISPECIES: cell division protein SepF [Mycobacterium]MBI2701822.1 cell division protein SepF [Mycobacterium sp.]MCQ4364940.1 cell division protein SepF [Mycobacterium gordonae]MCV7005989.1 cell division protein SepF [Mycobacterium gordonae]OBR99795.1 cell division protein SepF [Mycobacterium gordonae]ODR20141.1 cell division protein SepF [Mycobacterium gordonae]